MKMPNAINDILEDNVDKLIWILSIAVLVLYPVGMCELAITIINGDIFEQGLSIIAMVCLTRLVGIVRPWEALHGNH